VLRISILFRPLIEGQLILFFCNKCCVLTFERPDSLPPPLKCAKCTSGIRWWSFEPRTICAYLVLKTRADQAKVRAVILAFSFCAKCVALNTPLSLKKTVWGKKNSKKKKEIGNFSLVVGHKKKKIVAITRENSLPRARVHVRRRGVVVASIRSTPLKKKTSAKHHARPSEEKF
jgi:hypothetical protein